MALQGLTLGLALGLALVPGALAAPVAGGMPAARAPHTAPAAGRDQAILGTIPAYPGASRPLRAWENPQFAIAMSEDKLERIVAYYIDRLSAQGWDMARADQAEALAAAEAGEPAWLTFRRSGVGRLDLEFSPARHPKTGHPVTVIFYHSQIKS